MLGVFPTDRKIIDLLSPVTSYMHCVNEPGRGYTTFKRELFDIEPDGTFMTMSGLESRVIRRLSAYGYRVAVQRIDPVELYCDLDRLDEEDLANLVDRDDQVAVLGLVVDLPHGFIVEAPTGWGKSYALAQICKILPKAKIAIVTPGRTLASALYTRLRKHIRDVGRAGDGFKDIRRITISTMTSVGMLSHTNKPWDLVLCDEVHRAGAPQTSEDFISAFPTAKCIGFSASPTGRTDNADTLVEAMFGPILYKVGYSDAVKRGSIVPVNVVMVPVDHGPDYPSGTRTDVVNRNGLWRNDYRNRLIADIVNAIPDEDQCLILVATADHLWSLHQLLPNYALALSQTHSKRILNSPDWALVPGATSTGSMEREYLKYLRTEFEEGRVKKAIATPIWDTGVDFKQLKYLIRADGGRSSIKTIQSLGRLSRTHEEKSVGVLVDFVDQFSASLLRRSATRIKTYRDAGHRVVKLPYNDNRIMESILVTGGGESG